MKLNLLLKGFCLFLFFSVNVSAQQWGNYTLYSVMNSNVINLIDTNNVAVHTWTMPTTSKTGYSTYMLPGGTLWRTVNRTGNSFTGGPICGQVQKIDWNGNVIWDYVYSTTQYCTHHDICPMPNGNVLLIAYERKTAAELTAAGGSQSIEIWPDKIVEVEPVGATGGNIVWEWHAWDHLVQNFNPAKANYQTSIVDHPELININFNTSKDWMHMNGVDFNPILNQVTFSCHNLHEIYVIDHSTTTAEAASHTGGNSGKGGDILYRWGNPAGYSAAGAQILKVVHDAHWITEGTPNAGYLVGYNNQGISTSASCVDIVDPPYNGYNYSITPGMAFSPLSYTLRQSSGGFNSNMGNSQQLPNGNMLVTVSTSGIIKEFDPLGVMIWSKTSTGFIPKAFRFDSCYVYNAAPVIPTIIQSVDTLYSTTAATYQWYFNGQQIVGAVSQYYVPSQFGNYLVRITDANGCVYRYSLDYNFTGVTGINSIDLDKNILIYPNPTSCQLNIVHSYPGNDLTITVSDMLGNALLKTGNVNRLDLSNFKNGLYLVRLSSPELGTITRKITLLH